MSKNRPETLLSVTADPEDFLYALRRHHIDVLCLGFEPASPSFTRDEDGKTDWRRVLEAMAATHQAQISWHNDDQLVILSCLQENPEVNVLLNELSSSQESERLAAVQRAGEFLNLRIIEKIMGLLAEETLSAEVEKALFDCILKLSQQRLSFGTPVMLFFCLLDEIRLEKVLERMARNTDRRLLPMTVDGLALLDEAIAFPAIEKIATSAWERALKSEEFNKEEYAEIEVCMSSAHSLGIIGGDRAVKMLHQMLSWEHGFERTSSPIESAAEALVRLVYKGTLPRKRLIELSRNSYWRVREGVLIGLSEFGNKEDIPLVLKMAEDANEDVRWRAATILKVHGEKKPAMQAMKSLQETGSPDMQTLADETLLSWIVEDEPDASDTSAFPESEWGLLAGGTLKTFFSNLAESSFPAFTINTGNDDFTDNNNRLYRKLVAEVVDKARAAQLRGENGVETLFSEIVQMSREIFYCEPDGCIGCYLLGLIGGKKALDVLAGIVESAMRQDNWNKYLLVSARTMIAVVLRRAGERGIPILERLLTDTEEKVRQFAIVSLVRINKKKAIDILNQMTVSADPRVRCCAVCGLSWIYYAKRSFCVKGVLTRGLKNYDRREIAYIQGIPDESEIVALFQKMAEDQDETVRGAVADACGNAELDGPPSLSLLSILTKLTNDSAVMVRNNVAKALTFQKCEESILLLEKLSTDESVEIRVATVKTLASFEGNEKCWAILEKMSLDREAAVRKQVASACRFFKGESVLGTLQRMSSDLEKIVRRCVADTLWRIEAEKSADLITKMILDPAMSVCQENFGAMSASRRPFYGKLLLFLEGMSKNPERFVRHRVAYTLGVIGGEKAKAILKEMAENTPPKEVFVVSEIEAALKKLKKRSPQKRSQRRPLLSKINLA